ncbi:stretch-activated Ca2+-permeable channel component-domain-containing protein [Mycena galericulata]|nr:stretch-activated Ca2+-permeable channel component-domain-containing protein [Mycena galericulata]
MSLTDRISMLPTALLLLLNAAISTAQTRPLLNANWVEPEQAPNPPFFTIPTGNQLAISVAAIVLSQGQGSWTGAFPSGGVLGVEDAGQMPFEIGVSTDAPIHQVVENPPMLGDTTATQALLFSPPFMAPTVPSPPTNYTLVVSATSNGLASMQQTACMLLAQKSSGTISNESLWLRDASGWRTEVACDCSYKVSGPIYFTTKSSSFSCPLVLQLPYCPSIAYAMPLSAPPSTDLVYTSANLPDSISAPIISSLTNFTTILTTFACGRDFYSPLVTCADCQLAYRTWLCTVSFPAVQTPTLLPPRPRSSHLRRPTPATLPFPSGDSYTQLLPCLETCTATDRACPNLSYGVGYVDSGAIGVQGGGDPGTWADNYGNVWCNSGQ